MERVTMRLALVAVALVGLILVGHEAHAARPAKPTDHAAQLWMPLEADLEAPAARPAKPTVAVPDRTTNCTVLGHCGKTNATELWMPQEANPYTRGCSKINGCRD